jgi:RimJ/RimL family protein N-acetyltransferase
VGDPGLHFHPLSRAEFPLIVGWLALPHVAEWWGTPLDLAGVEEKYGPCIDRTDPTMLFICLEGKTPIGLAQIYRLTDNPDYAEAVGISDAGGIDLFIGQVERCGVGLGPRIISVAAQLIWKTFPEVHGAMAGPSVRNVRSQRAFEKAGFHAVRQVTVPDEEEDELIFFCPRPTGG